MVAPKSENTFSVSSRMTPRRNCTSSAIVKKRAHRLPPAPDEWPKAVTVASTPVMMATQRTQECRTRTSSCMAETLTHALARRPGLSDARGPSASFRPGSGEVFQRRLSPIDLTPSTPGYLARPLERHLGPFELLTRRI